MAESYFTYSENEYQNVYQIMFSKNEQEINNNLICLKNWIKKEVHLPQNEDDKFLRKMLMLNKFSVEKTKGKLETFYSSKNFLPEFFDNYSTKDCSIQKVMKQSLYLPFPNITPNYERLILFKLLKKNQENFDALALVRMTLMSAELRVLSEDICTSDVLFIDMSEFTMSMMSKFTPRLLNNTFNYVNGSYTDRIKSMNFINVPSYASSLIFLLKSLIKSKLADRVHVYKDLESLYENIPRSVLPKDYGGEQASVKEMHNKWCKYMESHNAMLVERSKMKSNEKLRIGKPVNSELFGLEGSFQQIIID